MNATNAIKSVLAKCDVNEKPIPPKRVEHTPKNLVAEFHPDTLHAINNTDYAWSDRRTLQNLLKTMIKVVVRKSGNGEYNGATITITQDGFFMPCIAAQGDLDILPTPVLNINVPVGIGKLAYVFSLKDARNADGTFDKSRKTVLVF